MELIKSASAMALERPFAKVVAGKQSNTVAKRD